jgi:hypothetical protein
MPHRVIVETPEDLEDLRLMAYAAAHSINFGSTEHWDEDFGSETAFCFVDYRAAFVFILYCARNEIRYRTA